MIKWEVTEEGVKVLIPRPDNLADATWEKICIRLARNFDRLSIKVRRISSADYKSEK